MNLAKLNDGSKDYSRLATKELIRIVSEEHCRSINESLDTIITLLASAHRVEPGEEEVDQILSRMKKLREQFREHCSKESKLLFPLIHSAAKKNNDARNATADFIRNTMSEHSSMRMEMEQIKKMTLEYHVSVSASPSHKLAYAQMNDLEQDLRRVIFVEEEYIFPKIQKMFN